MFRRVHKLGAAQTIRPAGGFYPKQAPMLRLTLYALLLATLSSPSLLAQKTASDDPAGGGLAGWLKRLDEKRNDRLDRGLPLFTPFAAPSFSPEFGITVSGGFLYTFKTDRADSTLQRSSVPAAIGVSSNGSILASTQTTIYGPADRWRGYFNAWYRDNPDNYWGVGYQNARDREKGYATGYQRRWWRVNPTFVYRLAPHVFAGPTVDLNSTELSEATFPVAGDPDVLTDGIANQNAGVGGAVQYDSRDVIQNPYNGLFLELRGLTYGTFLGGENEYTAFSVDVRSYHQFGEERRVLAWEIFSRIVSEGAPWPELTQIGTPFDLRGYIWGRFRDRAGSFAIAEYRHMLRHRRENDLIGRFGWVVWAGVGLVSDGYESHFSNPFPNAGAGLRFEVEPRMNIRFDLGVGLETSSFYISFNEAF